MENLPLLAMAMLKAARKTNPALESMLSSQHEIWKNLSDKIKELEVNSFSNQSVSRLSRKTN